MGFAFRGAKEDYTRARRKSIAAYTAYTDHEIGRVIQQVQDMGKLDNTLIIYIVGDNGTSPEGTLFGTYNQMTAYNGIMNSAACLCSDAALQRVGHGRTPTRTWPSHGPGRSIRPLSGPSRWHRISAERDRAWRFRGPATLKTWAEFAPSSTTSSILFRPSSKPRGFRRPIPSTASSKSRSKA